MCCACSTSSSLCLVCFCLKQHHIQAWCVYCSWCCVYTDISWNDADVYGKLFKNNNKKDRFRPSLLLITTRRRHWSYCSSGWRRRLFASGHSLQRCDFLPVCCTALLYFHRYPCCCVSAAPAHTILCFLFTCHLFYLCKKSTFMKRCFFLWVLHKRSV